MNDAPSPAAPDTSDSRKIEWLEYEYEHTEKSSDWFWIVGLVGLLGVILAIIFKNFLFAIVIMISTFTVMMYAAREPEIVHFAVTARGVKVKNDLYPFKEIHAFALEEDDSPRLMIETSRPILPRIIIPLGDTNTAEIRRLMSKHVPEEPFEESLIDLLAERLGF